MKTFQKTITTLSLFLFATCFIAKSQTFKITIDQPRNGAIQLEPEIPQDGLVKSGTKIKVTTLPSKGFALDAGYYSIPGMWGQAYAEFFTKTFEVEVNQDLHIGASFIDAKEISNINMIQNVVYAQPGKKPLKYDVFSPKGAKNLPCIVIIHGGGWSSNNEDVMRGLARELAKDGKYVVFSIDYRWVKHLDGDETINTMNVLIEDVYGAIAHITEHASEYGADPTRICLTGDSAGGHLSAAAADMPNKIGDSGFGKTEGIYEFMPTYIPKNKTVEQIKNELVSSIKAVAPSYGVFNGDRLMQFFNDSTLGNHWGYEIAPLTNIPKASERAIPQFLTRGTQDFLIKDEDVTEYVNALVKAGQKVQYVQIGGAGHAFFDWKPDQRTKDTFYKYGVYYAAEMKAFFDSIVY